MKHPRSRLSVELIFHALAIALVIRGIARDDDMLEVAAAAASISALGRVVPTERVDRALDQVDRSLGGSMPSAGADPVDGSDQLDP